MNILKQTAVAASMLIAAGAAQAAPITLNITGEVLAQSNDLPSTGGKAFDFAVNYDSDDAAVSTNLDVFGTTFNYVPISGTLMIGTESFAIDAASSLIQTKNDGFVAGATIATPVPADSLRFSFEFVDPITEGAAFVDEGAFNFIFSDDALSTVALPTVAPDLSKTTEVGASLSGREFIPSTFDFNNYSVFLRVDALTVGPTPTPPPPTPQVPLPAGGLLLLSGLGILALRKRLT